MKKAGVRIPRGAFERFVEFGLPRGCGVVQSDEILVLGDVPAVTFPKVTKATLYTSKISSFRIQRIGTG